MGVHGLAPFLLKVYPNVVKTLPDRLKTLNGKRIIIDGTLLTQRLHFAPMPHKYRHVLGWYRIVKELKESDVQAVCVFDGRERSLAKQLEVERRRKIRRVTAARSAFEAERFKRLQNLALLSGQWSELELSARAEALSNLQSLLSDWKPDLPTQYLPPYLNHGGNAFKTQEYDDLIPQYDHSVDFSDLAANTGIPISSSQDFDAAPFNSALEDPPIPVADPASDDSLLDFTVDAGWDILPPLDQLPPDDRDLARLDPFIDELAVSERRHVFATTSSKESFTSTLMSQYIQFQQSIPRLESLPEPPSVGSPTEYLPDTHDEYAVSKNQQLLTVDESRLWMDLLRCSTPEEAQCIMRSACMLLAQKSQLISQSYLRRTHPPTLETYEQSKEILGAMGIPCIETTGPFEAEALASSLVLSGYADYVASEDSDVIIYEAPLIRNLSSRKDPLVVISGAEVRSGLQLDRASFIDFALLLGTDFSQRIKNVGPQRALKFIREHRTIERVLEKEKQYPPRVPEEAYLSQVARARQVFETLPPAPDAGILEPREMDEDAVNIVLRRYNLQHEISDHWQYRGALSGNYFHDNPSAS
ncbi:hypothetical protein EIP91_001235 [Steccherinum ochraceum]|uniref:PIN domain-like protein n=1 Tax=Steccherinum ochraceum TaxID=92696 RepID=A0A4V2MWJ6_9APHY|nr:hypothetical protein EIP91_001235 [Steccherinum ochraceum]